MMCQLCGKQTSEAVPCTGCGGLFYCSHAHRLAHSRVCHAEECSRMAEQMSRSEVRTSTSTLLLTALLHAFLKRILTLHLIGSIMHLAKRSTCLSLLQEIFSTPFPWTPVYADAEAVAKLVENYGGHMTPVWQAECPECAEEASDVLWQAAFEAWPTQEDSCRAHSQCTEQLGLSRELVPRLCQEVCSARKSSHYASWSTQALLTASLIAHTADGPLCEDCIPVSTLLE